MAYTNLKELINELETKMTVWKSTLNTTSDLAKVKDVVKEMEKYMDNDWRDKVKPLLKDITRFNEERIGIFK